MADSGSAGTASAKGAVRQMIGFQMGSDKFAIDIGKIHEIIKPLPITMVPDIPPGYAGMVHLRDQVVVIADLHTRFGIPAPEVGKESRIIVLEGGERRVGVLVDSVSKVVRLSDSMIEPPPAFSNGISIEYINGVGKLNGDLMTILDIERLFPEAYGIDGPDSPAVPEPPQASAAGEAATEDPQTLEQLSKQARIGLELYQDVGELARYINQAHANFARQIAEQEEIIVIKAKDLPTANDMLKKVTEHTESATMKLMSSIEETTQTLGSLGDLLSELEECVPASSKEKARISDILERAREEIGNVRAIQDEAMITLSFQDLTGQQIKQVINLMVEVEGRIIELVVKFGMDRAQAAEEAVDDKMHDLLTDEDPARLRQDRVDDMLAEFGF